MITTIKDVVMFILLAFRCVLNMLILYLVITNIIIVYFIDCSHVVVLLNSQYDVTHINEVLSLS